MTEKRQYSAVVRRKGLEKTGVTEDVARGMYASIDRTTLAVAEVIHKRQVNDADTGRVVEVVIIDFEPALTQDTEDLLRNLLRNLALSRKSKTGDTPLPLGPGHTEPSFDQVAAAIRAYNANYPHTFEAAEDQADEGCVVCGEDFDNDLHKPVTNPEPTLPDGDSDEDSEKQPANEDGAELYGETHAESDQTGDVALCGLPPTEDRDVDTTDDPDDVTCRLCLGLLEEDTEVDDPADEAETDPVLA